MSIWKLGELSLQEAFRAEFAPRVGGGRILGRVMARRGGIGGGAWGGSLGGSSPGLSGSPNLSVQSVVGLGLPSTSLGRARVGETETDR